MSDKIQMAIGAIESDLRGRAGISNEWEQIDYEVKGEILAEWDRLLRLIFTETSND